jgi:hypothetical protein
MNLWGKGRQIVLFFFLALFACDDETYLLGFKSPDENFKVVYQEFKLPTTIFQVDSLITSNSSTSTTNRLQVGSFSDSRFGNGTAKAFMQYFLTSVPAMSDTAVFDRISMTLVYDLYHFGSTAVTPQTYDFYELTDSLVNSVAYYSKSTTPYQPVSVGSATRSIDPSLFDELVTQNNSDKIATNNSVDSLNVDLSYSFGKKIWDAIRKNDSVSIVTYRNFGRFRRIFKGLAMVPTSSDKIVGFDPGHAKSRIILHYREGTAVKEIRLTVSPIEGMMTYTNLTVDRSSTPLNAVTEFYKDYEPAGGQRFIHSGGGILAKVDLSPVLDYFETISIKALNVAELSIGTDVESNAPSVFLMRAVKKDNHTLLGLARGINNAYDSVSYADPRFIAKHYINSSSAPRADMLGDDGGLFTLQPKATNTGTSYKGYMTTFLQREVDLADKDYLRYFTIIPSYPEFGKSVNGFYFHKDSVKLRIYYTTPLVGE